MTILEKEKKKEEIRKQIRDCHATIHHFSRGFSPLREDMMERYSREAEILERQLKRLG